MTNAIKKFFKIDERKSSIKTELLAGLTTFLAMVYILPVNAGMLSQTGMPYGGVFLATALAAIIATLVMGLVANFPVALAPGMGVNAFFTFTVVLFGFKQTWQFALAATLIAGIIFLAISATGVREKIINAIPMGLKYAVGAGIGFFITFIGLQNSGLIVGGATLVQLGSFANAGTLLTLFGLVVVLVLFIRGNRYSLIIAMGATMAVGLIFGFVFPEQVEHVVNGEFIKGLPALPEFNFEVLFKDLGTIKEIFGACFKEVGTVLSTKIGWLCIFTFLFIDFFDTAGTLSAVGVSAGLLNEKTGELENGGKALLADAIGTVAGAILGTSTTTSFVESEIGIEQGGRTGLTAVTVAALFTLAIFFYPVFAMFNSFVTSIALIMVGAMMVGQLAHIDWSDKVLTVSAFFTIIFMLLTYSIADGIAIGFTVYAILMVSTSRRKEVSPIMYGLAIFFVLHYLVDTLHTIGLL